MRFYGPGGLFEELFLALGASSATRSAARGGARVTAQFEGEVDLERWAQVLQEALELAERPRLRPRRP